MAHTGVIEEELIESRLRTALSLVRELSQEREAIRLFSRFTSEVRKVIRAERVTIRLSPDGTGRAVCMTSALDVPLTTPTSTYGVVSLVRNRVSESFSDDDWAVATTLVSTLALAYENILRGNVLPHPLSA